MRAILDALTLAGALAGMFLASTIPVALYLAWEMRRAGYDSPVREQDTPPRP